jgi:DNA segregation ATPase FtsK/SpoIIIE-like protein
VTISPPVTVDQPVDQARDPVLSDDGGRTHLVYAVAGESGLALAGVTW